jgi:S1/P1 Nuclease
MGNLAKKHGENRRESGGEWREKALSRMEMDVPQATVVLPVSFGVISRPNDERRSASRFVTHLVGNLHMPLHVGDNHERGGNDTQVRFFDRGRNMHSVWDSGMIERAGGDEDAWLAIVIATHAGYRSLRIEHPNRTLTLIH